MTTFQDLKNFFKDQDFKLIIAANAETIVHNRKGDQIVYKTPAGGVSVALDPIARSSNAIYVGRGKTEVDREVVDKNNKIIINGTEDKYTLKRVFFSEDEVECYYNGFSNQTLWPLCHVAFERPEFKKEWYEGYRRVNQKFAEAIRQEIKGKTFIWINDYQLALVPKFLGKPKDTVVAMFWHIPWPTWEAFRILPPKKEILESLLMCDFLAFHRGYQARNFLKTVEREFEARIDDETNKVYFNKNVTTVKNLPMGVDTEVIRSLIDGGEEETFISKILSAVLGETKEPRSKTQLDVFFDNHKVILGVDRLDYTKGLRLRLFALDKFFNDNPQCIGKVVYLGITAPSREDIPAYKALKKEIREISDEINKKYERNGWKPINLIYNTFARRDIINFYKKANVCIVTPLDDGMNLVSKEFIIGSSFSKNPGMLVLSQFAGSAIDLTSALIVNPYDIDEVSTAIKKGLEMNKAEKIDRIKHMTEILDEKNIYEWAKDFIKSAQIATRENRK